MKSVICTLFESHYHFGVAALVNSLHCQGYEGDVYAGYLGSLPKWAKMTEHSTFENGQIETFFVNESIKIHFVPLKTTYHLANYKPDFIEWLLNGPAKGVENIFYFDSDIIINYNWAFFEEWASYGVTVCEDVNSPLPLNHPRKMAWCKYFQSFRIPLKFHENIYANSGFIGINKRDMGFISSWIIIQEKIAPLIGGLDRSPFPGKGYLSEEHRGNYSPFNKTDQDALNVTIGTWDGVVSFIGKEGMAIKPGPEIMFHAMGRSKPWGKNFIKWALTGYPPSRADKAFWLHTSKPISLYHPFKVRVKKMSIALASLIGRFYSRS